MLSDAELLRRARELDTDALAAIHDTYYQSLYRYVSFRISDRQTCEDLVSEVFMRPLTALHQRKAPTNNLRGWLFGVASHVVSDYFRQTYHNPNEPLNEQIVSQAPLPAEIAEKEVAIEKFRKAISTLTEDQQHVLALRFGENLPIHEIAHLLGKTEGAVKQLQARALAALARHLAPGMVK
ncbi:ECF subfamily RNA polymerase sigma factor, BldN family [Chloroflexus sp.]|uniref:ECF subfamily RNA polymerase sigma factor, BldN family n=1 Tax=Chloroflexus sp. TaxID=1904827 RepID=UPI002ACEDA86|nr:ECF subfamily RNA polymerase sigma factor, BldN family [Chloroflexus sp.]